MIQFLVSDTGSQRSKTNQGIRLWGLVEVRLASETKCVICRSVDEEGVYGQLG